MALTGSAVRAIGMSRPGPLAALGVGGTVSGVETTVPRRLTPPDGYHLAGSVGSLLTRRTDPCATFADGALWFAARTPAGPGTLHLARAGVELIATGYGPGAGWLAERA